VLILQVNTASIVGGRREILCSASKTGYITAMLLLLTAWHAIQACTLNYLVSTLQHQLPSLLVTHYQCAAFVQHVVAPWLARCIYCSHAASHLQHDEMHMIVMNWYPEQSDCLCFVPSLQHPVRLQPSSAGMLHKICYSISWYASTTPRIVESME
jgi:hypothetical protein